MAFAALPLCGWLSVGAPSCCFRRAAIIRISRARRGRYRNTKELCNVEKEEIEQYLIDTVAEIGIENVIKMIVEYISRGYYMQLFADLEEDKCRLYG